MSANSAIETLLAAVDADDRDRLFPLVDGGAVVRGLTGHQPHRSALHRWAARGLAGVRLRTITVGRRRFTTRRWLLNWFAAVDEAQRSVQREAE